MPTTANGTPYTVSTTSITGYGSVYYGVADAHAADPHVRAILYAHGAGGPANQFASLAAWQGLRDWLMDNGWCFIEGTGGTNSNGAQSWGNADARAAYPAYLAYVKTQINISDVVLLGRSMGGLVTAWMYNQSPDAATYLGWINNSGVSTMFVGDRTGAASNTDDLSTSYYFRSGMWGAWGVSSEPALFTAASAYAPESWPASSWTGKNIISLYGDADHTVPFTTRGAGPLRTIWAGKPTVDTTDLRAGGDHSTSNGSYLQTSAMTSFLIQITGGTPPDPPVGFSSGKILKRYIFINGASHLVHPRLY